MSIKHPDVLWAQRADSLYITIDLPDVDKASSKITVTKEALDFEGNSHGSQFRVHLDFFKPVDEENAKVNVFDRNVHFFLQKAETDAEFWPRLIQDKNLAKTFIKTDWSRYVDEDDDGEEFDTSAMDSMPQGGGGMGGGMPGMPGMGAGGMPPGGLEALMAQMGKGGMGGAGGGMPDLQSMMAGMGQGGNPGGMPSGFPAGGDEETDSDDDEQMPDLAPDDPEDDGSLEDLE